MSKNFNVDISSFSATNDMDSIYAGGTPNTEKVAPADTTKTKNKTNTNKSDTIDHTKTKDKKTGNFNKKNNYAVSIKIDEDLKDYLSKIEWVKMLSDRVSTNKNKYINDLIRADMLKRLNLKDNATYEETQKAWDNYKKANNI